MASFSGKVTIDDVDFAGKRVVCRVDYNVPMKQKNDKLVIADTGRIDASIPTLKKILSQKPKSIVLLSHMGRPQGRRVEKFSLRPLVPYIEQILDHTVRFLEDCVGPETQYACTDPPTGTVFLCENLRFHVAEVGKGKDADGKKVKAEKGVIEAFRKSLTNLGDVYVNDAFGAAHRAHSSVVGIDLPIKAAGYILARELKAFGKVLNEPDRPFLAILGGAKVRDKLPLITNLLDKVDDIIITGAMAYTFLKVNNNMPIGNSLFDKKGALIVQDIMTKANEKGVKLHFPVDFLIGDKFSADCKISKADDKTGIPDGWMALDVGPLTRLKDAQVIWKAKTVVCNGPVGVFEFPAFAYGTISSLQAVAAATALNGATTIIGGGDTAAACRRYKFETAVTHVSTGGGASLELLEGKALPGIMYLTDKATAKL